MMEWKDNSEHLLTDNVEKVLPFANAPVSSFLDDKGKSLLVFPLSFQECEDCMAVNTCLILHQKGRAMW
ncbi:unknown [Prevotella sp. CAG:1320]|nr:unknown [Prevotella sp. CAG:1320]